MPHFKISTKVFPELKGNIRLFKKFMTEEFEGYLRGTSEFYAHNEADSGWFPKQFLDAKHGKGIYQDFFKKINKAS